MADEFLVYDPHTHGYVRDKNRVKVFQNQDLAEDEARRLGCQVVPWVETIDRHDRLQQAMDLLMSDVETCKLAVSALKGYLDTVESSK